MRREALERENGFNPFADDCKVINEAEANAVTQNSAERASWRGNVRFGVARRIKKGAMNPHNRAGMVGDGGDKRGESTRRRVRVFAIDQRSVIAQRRIVQLYKFLLDLTDG